MKIIFLDFDGVLNSRQFYSKYNKEIRQARMFDTLSREHIARLNTIVEVTGAKIVISSTWRMMHTIEELRGFLTDFGFKYIDNYIGNTPVLYKDRGHEIQSWLDNNEQRLDYSTDPVKSFVILDDNSDMIHLIGRLVQTTWEHGLQDEHVKRAIEILGA